MNSNLLSIHLLAKNDEFFTNFNFILQNGFRVDAVLGCTVYDFLREQCHLHEEYIKARISTIFLDGKPVDDMEKAILERDSALSLSGAMPGLVGAVMKTGSIYASFRAEITYKNSIAKSEKKKKVFSN